MKTNIFVHQPNWAGKFQNLPVFVFPERPSHVQLRDGQQQCVVCLDLANGVHFGAVTCEGCKVRAWGFGRVEL